MMCCCLSEGFDLIRFLVTSAARSTQSSRFPRGRGSQPWVDGKAGYGICCNERAEHETEFESPDQGH